MIQMLDSNDCLDGLLYISNGNYRPRNCTQSDLNQFWPIIPSTTDDRIGWVSFKYGRQKFRHPTSIEAKFILDNP